MIVIIRVFVIITISLIFIIKNNDNDEKFKVIPISIFLLLPATSFPFSLLLCQVTHYSFFFLIHNSCKEEKNRLNNCRLKQPPSPAAQPRPLHEPPALPAAADGSPALTPARDSTWPPICSRPTFPRPSRRPCRVRAGPSGRREKGSRSV